MSAGPRLEIRYCRRCRFLPRASWIAQELLTSFAEELGEVALLPGEDGVFQVDLGAERIWCRERDGGFPELAELKRRLRDRIAPGKSLGHSEGGE
jgi:selenoprotein W-related protein